MVIAITVTGKDRPGIIAAVTGALYRTGGNLEDASMTILEGEFAMIFLSGFKDKAGFGGLQKKLAQLEREFNLVISVKEVKHALTRGEKHRPGTAPWVVSVLGRDRAGIVYQVSRVLADRGLNITDLNSKIVGRGRQTSYILILEVDIPKNPRLVSALKRKFIALQKKLRVKISLNPVELSRF